MIQNISFRVHLVLVEQKQSFVRRWSEAYANGRWNAITLNLAQIDGNGRVNEL